MHFIYVRKIAGMASFMFNMFVINNVCSKIFICENYYAVR